MRANGVIGSDYVYFTEKVGSVRKEVGFHGYIAIIVGSSNAAEFQVFVKVELIQCGFIPVEEISFKNIALGKNLVVTRASNKGGVRVRLGIDLGNLSNNLVLKSSIDFICCHLAADISGESKIEKRNKDAQYDYNNFAFTSSELIHSLVYDTSNPQGFVFIVGDLNYRINLDAKSVYSIHCSIIHSV